MKLALLAGSIVAIVFLWGLTALISAMLGPAVTAEKVFCDDFFKTGLAQEPCAEIAGGRRPHKGNLLRSIDIAVHGDHIVRIPNGEPPSVLAGDEGCDEPAEERAIHQAEISALKGKNK